MASETTRYETHQKDSYNISFGMIGGRKNKYNSPDHGKPSKKPGKPRKQRKPSHNNNHNTDDDEDDDDNNNNHPEQSHPPQQVAFQPAPGAYAYAYTTPYPYQCPQQGDYLVPGYYPAGSFVPHQGGYGGGHVKDVGLVGAAIGVASFGLFKLLRERRRYGGRY